MNNRLSKVGSVALLVMMLLAVSVAPVAAQSSITGLDTIAQKVLDVMSGSLVKLILTIALVGLGIGLIVSRDNDAMKKRFIVWLVAVAVLRGASEIVGLFYGS